VVPLPADGQLKAAWPVELASERLGITAKLDLLQGALDPGQRISSLHENLRPAAELLRGPAFRSSPARSSPRIASAPSSRLPVISRAVASWTRASAWHPYERALPGAVPYRLTAAAAASSAWRG